MSDVMLPCPYCGKSDRLKVVPYRFDDDGGEPFNWGFMVRCSAGGFDGDPLRGCGSSSGWGETREDAIAAWNLRSALSPTKQEETPVAWRYYDDYERGWSYDEVGHTDWQPLYRSPSVSREAIRAEAFEDLAKAFDTEASRYQYANTLSYLTSVQQTEVMRRAKAALSAPEHGERTI